MQTKTISFSIPEFLYEEFSNYCKSNDLNKSAISRGLIYSYLKDKIQNASSPIFQIIEE